MPGRATVRPSKVERVAEIRARLLRNPVTALVALRGVPAAALQQMRRDLRGRGHPLLVAPNSAIRHALEEAAKERPALRPLLEHVTDQTGIISAEGNPFSLFRELDSTRSPTPARRGAIAPRDVVVPAGDTPFKPGPIVAELQHAGFPAAIEKGKVVIKKDATIVKAGEAFTAERANLLTRLGIFPLEIGLELRAAVELEVFYSRETLAVDLGALRSQFGLAHRSALALALELGYATRATTPLLLAKAHRAAMALAISAAYPTSRTIPELVARALREALALSALTGAPTS